ncbi:MAG: SsrA-binding protein SmpB [Planctomycetota bacterium]|nr:SsrA-binding protein SmpB [Planctomycetota bacterium]
MAKKNTKKKETQGNSTRISENRKARHKYTVVDTLECGIVLLGSEVKSLREGKVSLDEAYGRVIRKELYLVGCDIAIYTQASSLNHKPRRDRKLLLHKLELRKFTDKALTSGHTLIPLKMYFNDHGIAKVLMGLCKGKKSHDKRESIKQRETQRGLDRAMRAKR